MQRISRETAAWKLFRPSLFRRSLASTFLLTRNFFRRRADRFRQKIVEIGGILAIFVFGNHTLSLLETTHCPVWKAHIVLFGKHTLSCLESTHCPVWKAHILLSGEHRFSCLESTHSLVWKAHILVFRKHTFSCLESTTPGMTVFRTPVSAKRVAGGVRGGREPECCKI